MQLSVGAEDEILTDGIILPFSALPFSLCLFPCCLWRGARQTDERRERERQIMRQGEAEMHGERGEVVRDRARVGCHASAPCVAASKYPAPH